jgi:ADP-ribosylglycohydrolase
MIGAIAGDIIGSVYEGHNITIMDFPLFDPLCRFTDDTVLTVAVADAIMTGSGYEEKFKEYFMLYPNRGYGPRFKRWAPSRRNASNNSIGNGSAMRVSPIGFAFDSLEKVLTEAKRSAVVTHNSDGGIRGAQAVASIVFLARMGSSKTEMKNYVEQTFGYDLRQPLDKIRQYYYRHHDATCDGSVPQAITAFLESNDYEDAIRKAISIGGDSDTIACMAGGIAEAYYRKIPDHILSKTFDILDEKLREVVRKFMGRRF